MFNNNIYAENIGEQHCSNNIILTNNHIETEKHTNQHCLQLIKEA